MLLLSNKLKLTVINLTITKAQLRIIKLIAKGYGQKEAAEELNIGLEALRSMLRYSRRVLNAKTTAELIYLCAKKKLI